MIRQSEQELQKLFTRRALLLGAGKLGLASALFARLYYLQVVEADRYAMLADDNRINLRLLPPPRGRIFDRTGERLADNVQNYRVVLVPEQTPDVLATLDALGRLIPVPEHVVRRVLREVRRRRAFVPVTVVENLSWEEMARVEVNAPDLPGIAIDAGRSRFYPYGEKAVHLVGYVAAVSESELGDDPLLELPEFRIGKNGVEKQHDLDMRGKAGSLQVEVNAVGRIVRELARNEGEAGQDIVLTIDMGLQAFAAERFGEESGGAVVLDVHTGDVLALVSTPGYDPSGFNQGLSARDWEELLSNPRTPLTNKAIAGQFAPGSTFKMLVALAALEAGIAGPEFRAFCPGHMDFGNHRFHCWKKGGHGTVNMVQAIERSCDVYFFELGKRLGIDRIAQMARRFGLGQKLALDLPGEKAGLIPDRAWKMGFNGIPWQPGENLSAAIGQSYVLATPLQLAVMTARIANGGFAVTPRVLAYPASADRRRFEPVGVSEAHLRIVRDGMIGVTNNPNGGTAYRQRIAEKGMEMAGKTGTAQVRNITKAQRERGLPKLNETPWRERDHALFVAFAPVHAPRYCIAVVVQHGGGGASVAAPIARDIMLEVQRRDPLRHPPYRPRQSVVAAAPRRAEAP